MKKSYLWSRLLPIVLCLCMVLSLTIRIPGAVAAAGTEGMITIALTDSYGDGWSDNAIAIYADGELLDTVTMDSGASATWTTKIDTHVSYEFRWVSGVYAQETSFVIYYGTTEKVSASGFDYVDGATILTIAKSCSGTNYANGACTSCGAACTHRYVGEDGKCADCGYACAGHNWTDGVCSVCSGVCLHQAYKSGACTVCGKTMILSIELEDVYSDGWTGNAINIYANEELLGSVTVDVGFSTSWSVDYVMTNAYAFEWVTGNYANECSFRILLNGEVRYEATTEDCAALKDGVFFTLEPWCDHAAYDDNYCCITCGKTCPHSNIQPNGTCGVCGFTCGTSAPHAWDGDNCSVCGFVCVHGAWTDSVCGSCGLVCGSDVKHNFDATHTCSRCGFVCGTTAPHTWDNGTCTLCGLGCTHESWANSVCNGCGLACGVDVEHSFNASNVCTLCGFGCGTTTKHTWDNGTCTVCGAVCTHKGFNNGICSDCSYYQPAVENGVGENGFALYEIHNAGQLLWFADYVNSNAVLSDKAVQEADAEYPIYFAYTTGCVNGKLMADINMSGLPWTPIGIPYVSDAVSRNSYGYAGVFDGAGHTVSGIDCAVVSAENTVYAGFFGALGGGTVKNLTVQGDIQGVANTVQYPAAYVGGIAGYVCEWFDYPGQSQTRQDVYSVIENCTFIGTVSVSAKDQEFAGGIVGIASGTYVTNCLSAAWVSATQIGSYGIGSVCGCVINDCTIANCWYDSDLSKLGAVNSESHAGVTGASGERMAQGAVAYALGFGQTLGVDAYPSYGDDAVYQVTDGCCTYSNTPVDTITEKAHTGGVACFGQAICDDCHLPYGEAMVHKYTATVTNPTCTEPGYTTYTCTCGDSYTEPIAATGHDYTVKVIEPTCTEAGATVYTCACGDSYSEPIAATGHDYTVKVVEPTCTEEGSTTYTCACGHSYSESIPTIGHDYTTQVTEPTCVNPGSITYTCACGDSYTESIAATGHSYETKVTEPTCTEPGLTVYSCVCGHSFNVSIPATGHTYTTSVVAPTCTADGYATHACACGYSFTETISATGHGNVNGICPVCGEVPVVVPTLKLAYPSLSFKDVINYNIYYTVSDMTDVVEMGLITFDSETANGTVDNADHVIPGYSQSGSRYVSCSQGIAAKKLGDTIYFQAYAKLSDGSYVYSEMRYYDAITYAKDRLENSTNQAMKTLVVAMLNYGASAQIHFGYKTDNLMNSFLTDEQKALVEDYRSDMADSLVAVDSNKLGAFAKVNNGYSSMWPSVLFDGAFSINYYFTPSKAMDSDLKLYYWTLNDYNAASVLTAENASGVITMKALDDGSYVAAVSDIAARQIDQTVFVCGVYESEGVSYSTGVISYSIAAYCQDRIAKGSATMQEMAKATAVYGYYAKAYFG